MRVQSLGFRTDLGLRRLGGSTVSARDGYLTVKTPSNPGHWWGNFLLLPGPLRAGQGEQVRARFAEEFPGASHLAVGIDGTDGEVGDPGEVAALGVKAEVDVVLTAERLREPARPRVGAGCRPLASDDDWAQAVPLRMAAWPDSDTPDQRDFVERQLRAERAMCARGSGAWFGAFVDGRLVAALGLLAAEPGLARYQTVETLPDHRREGLASRLLYESSVYGNDVLGAHALVIVADPDYHAIGLYRALGFRDAERQVQLLRQPSGSQAQD